MVVLLTCSVFVNSNSVFSAWLDDVFLPQHKLNLQKAFGYCKQRLEKLDVYVYPSKASLFIWADFSKVILYLEPTKARIKLFGERGAINIYWFKISSSIWILVPLRQNLSCLTGSVRRELWYVRVLTCSVMPQAGSGSWQLHLTKK